MNNLDSLSKIKSTRQDLTFSQLKIYYKEKGLKFSEDFYTPLRTIERCIKQLTDEDKIEFKGTPKIGGYYAKEKEKIDTKTKIPTY